MTDEDCLRIEQEAISYLIRVVFDDYSIVCEEVNKSIKKAIRGLNEL